jgi:triphosphoribosyl-dephospho-CoA synthase
LLILGFEGNLSMKTSLYAQVSCLWEVTARKVGNVHGRRDLPGLGYNDFLLSAAAIGPAFKRAWEKPVGQIVLEAIQATRGVVSSNTNLGIVLLLAPLASVPVQETLVVGVEKVLGGLTVEDARQVFAAIRLARPGGLGRATQEDVNEEPTLPLRDIMALAADRDLVARQYAHGFREVLQEGVPALQQALDQGLGVEEAIIVTQLTLLAQHPDSLIARKRGVEEASEASRRAGEVLRKEPGQWERGLEELDRWLCAEGNGRNPGTSADLVTACLFVALREGIIKLPLQHPWSTGWQHG